MTLEVLRQAVAQERAEGCLRDGSARDDAGAPRFQAHSCKALRHYRAVNDETLRVACPSNQTPELLVVRLQISASRRTAGRQPGRVACSQVVGIGPRIFKRTPRPPRGTRHAD